MGSRPVADAGRVIAGTARGTRLEAPGDATRPLGDRVKQTLFAILEPDLRDARVLDLFAGSGAAGIEALSRGAAHATFVERDRVAAAVIATNLARTRLAGGRARVVRADVLTWLAAQATEATTPFHVAIVDPPYGDPALFATALQAVGPLIARDGRVVAKHFWRTEPPGSTGLLASERVRRFGETTLTFYRRVEDR